MFSKHNAKEPIIGIFAGTGFDFVSNVQPAARISLPGSESDPITTAIDTSFSNLADSLYENTELYGYDGCHRRGGGLLTVGIEDPADDFYARIQNELKSNPKKKLKLLLIGHERGALSAILLAKKISANPQLKKKVEIVLDLRDPSLANLYAQPLSDLTNCRCIKEVHITIQEAGHKVLVPQFHPKTKLNVEFLPGTSSVQEYAYIFDKEDNKKIIKKACPKKGDPTLLGAHPALHLIGLLKSLQIIHEHGDPIDYVNCIATINEYLNVTHVLPEKILDPLHEELTNKYSAGQYVEGFDQFLKLLQIHLYDSLLNEFSNPSSDPIYKKNLLSGRSSRNLDFGGQFAATSSNPTRANCFNMRHAALIQEMLGPNHPGYYPRPLLGLKAGIGEKPWKKRVDLNNARFIKIPDNLFQQKYQRIMLVLDQQIKSNLVIPKSIPKKLYIDVIKKHLIGIAEANLSDTQKLINMETYLLHMYWEVRAHEGMLDSRLRRGLEWILNAPLFLNIKGRYGLSFPEKPEDDNFKRKDLLDTSVKLANTLSYYAKGIENHPKLYQHGIKFFHELEKIRYKTKRKREVNELVKMVHDLFEAGKDKPQEDLFATFKIKLLTKYEAIREHESSKYFSYFRVSTLGNFIEKFLRDELKIKDIPHEYNPNQIDKIIASITNSKPLSESSIISSESISVQILRDEVEISENDAIRSVDLDLVARFKVSPFYQPGLEANLEVNAKYPDNKNILKVRNNETSEVKYFIYSEESKEFYETIEYKSLRNDPEKESKRRILGQGGHGKVHTRGNTDHQIAVKKTTTPDWFAEKLYREDRENGFMTNTKKANETFIYCMKHFDTIGKHFCVPLILENVMASSGKQIQRKIDGVDLSDLTDRKYEELTRELLQEENGETVFSKKFDEFIAAVKELGIGSLDSVVNNIMYDKKEKCFVLIDFDAIFYTKNPALPNTLSNLKTFLLERLIKSQNPYQNPYYL